MLLLAIAVIHMILWVVRAENKTCTWFHKIATTRLVSYLQTIVEVEYSKWKRYKMVILEQFFNKQTKLFNKSF